MSSKEEWREYKFSEILSTPLRNGVNKPTKVRGDGYKMVNMGELFANPIIRNMEMARVPMTDSELKNCLLQSGDLLFARQSLTIEGAGKCTLFICDDEPYTFEGHLIRARVDRALASPQYIYYYFNSFVGKSKIETLVHVTAAAGIRSSELNNLKIDLPPLSTQRRIVDILSALDEKIELNRQVNVTLEAMAQAIFKEWFVDFNFPNTTGEMVESELGMIPQGWQVYRLEQLIDSASITHKFEGREDIIFLNTSDIDNGKVLNHAYTPVNELPGQAKKSIKELDILFTEIRPANKRFALIDFDAEDYVVSTKLMVLRSKSHVHPIVIYFYITSEETLSWLQHQAESRSGTFPQITFNHIKELQITLPPKPLLDKYTNLAWSSFQKIKHNEKEIDTLIALRDTLLPKLMSGELSVKG